MSARGATWLFMCTALLLTCISALPLFEMCISLRAAFTLRFTFTLRLTDAEPAERTAELLFAAAFTFAELLRLTFALRLAAADELPALAEVLRLTDAAPRELFAAERETLPALLRTVSVAWFEEFETLLCPHASLPRVANITKMLRTNANLTVLFMILVLLELSNTYVVCI